MVGLLEGHAALLGAPSSEPVQAWPGGMASSMSAAAARPGRQTTTTYPALTPLAFIPRLQLPSDAIKRACN